MIRLQSFTRLERAHILPRLRGAVHAAGGWVLQRRTLTPDALEFTDELQVPSLVEIYGALLASGLQLTRESHRALAERCNCSLYLGPRRGLSSFLVIRMEVYFLPDSKQELDLSSLVLVADTPD